MNQPKSKKLPFILILMMLGFFLLFGWFYRLISAPLIPLGGAPIVLRVDSATSALQFVSLLKKQGLIHSAKLALFVIRLKGLSQRLKAGVYQIKPGQSLLSVLEQVSTGAVLIQNFKIIEGSTQEKVTEDLAKAAYLDYRPEDWLLIKAQYPNAEGLLLADTYQYRGGSRSLEILQQAHHHLMLFLDEAWNHRDPEVPYHDAYQLLIAASIIEKETALPVEKKLISGVIMNRLKKKMPLQMDPTVIYALGKAYHGKLAHQDMQIQSSYNSYLNRGLPPTPIAMAGKEAIEAAAHPQHSKYLYFVAKGDGSHQFSETYEQQKQAIEHFRHKDL